MSDVVTTVTIIRPAAYSHCRADEISWDLRGLLREAVEGGVNFASETARDEAREIVAQVNDLLDQFLPH